MAASLESVLQTGSRPKVSATLVTKSDAQPVRHGDSNAPQTVDALLRNRAQLWPQRRIISYPSSGIAYVDYTLLQLDVFAYRVGRHYQQMLPPRTSSAEKPAVIALLGPSNFAYMITMLALIKLGHTVLFLSTRLTQEAIESLLTSTETVALLADPRHIDMAYRVKASLGHVRVAEIVRNAVFDFPVQVHGDTRLDSGLDHNLETSNFVYIIHSSGSTGVPKAIWQTHKAALANFEINMQMDAFTTLPLYHNHGICNFYRAIHSGKSIYMYNADLPLTSDNLTRIFVKHKFEIFYGVPYALKLLAETEAGINLLKDLKIVMYGGSACPDELGDLLVNCDVNLVSHYGATEVGQLMTSFRPQGDKAWNYVRENKRLSPFLKWLPRGSNLFECCVLEGWPAKLQANQPDGSYATKDLFEPHPTIPKAWKYIARLDDTIVLNNGEKFNPVQMEGAIRSNAAVAETVVFGAGRHYLGLLIVPALSTSGLSSEKILDLVWPTVEASNKNADGFAKISKDMVKVLPHDCPCPRTDKGSIIRQAFYKTFQAEIEAAYDELDASSTELKTLNLDELKEFIRTTVSEVMPANEGSLDETRDFFNYGMDSLQSIRIRSLILRNVDVGGKKVAQNVVFDHPSIAKLAAHLSSLRTGESVSQISVEEEMETLVSKYAVFKPRVPHPRSSVAVTGATGSLGAHVVARLAKDSSIRTIYCLVRATTAAQALNRVRDSLVQRKVYHNLPLEARAKLVALPFNQSEEQLGLDESTFRCLIRDLRSVIHCAWSVNFNMHLSSFEADCIAGVQNLINLCLAAEGASPASFNFCSSVSTTARAPIERIPERLVEGAWAQQMGYAQSKSVAEHICMRAAALAGVKARVLRVGQIIGDTQHGIWNSQEAIPMMMQTALTVGALPRLSETPSWLPVDTVAQAVLDISLSSADSLVANVANPKTFSWSDDLLPALAAAGLQFETIEPREWVRRLKASDPDPEVNPPIRLVEFLASKYDKDEFPSSKSFVTDVACALSPALVKTPVFDSETVKKSVRYFLGGPWRRSVPKKNQKTVVILAGPCGSGKSTVGQQVATWLGGAFIEGDSLHTRDAVGRMSSRSPLRDEDRWAWIERIKSQAKKVAFELGYDVVSVSCSALRKSYRDKLRELIRDGMDVVFVDLQANPETLMSRLRKREGHYMSSDMVKEQVEIYDQPTVEEGDVWPLSAEGTREEINEELKWALSRVFGELEGRTT